MHRGTQGGEGGADNYADSTARWVKTSWWLIAIRFLDYDRGYSNVGHIKSLYPRRVRP